ncbi:MAG: peptidoglycan DD-metalloendopeptidase family protein [Chloroflexi bacterium]|nr:peptidoglycan DD-metalloendopeptidase family protein [Chloroflexota bacterium]
MRNITGCNAPIPEGGTVWTDKTYPYGSTRGGTLRPHHGVEFNVGKGTQILAAAGGTVVAAGEDNIIAYGPHTNFYGKLVIIELDVAYQGQPVYNLYGHLSENSRGRGEGMWRRNSLSPSREPPV